MFLNPSEYPLHMKKLAITGAVILLILIGIYFVFIAPKPATAAILYVERGSVEVNTGSGWQPGADEMELAKGSQVRTADGEATVVFYEGEITHLEPNTEIKLDEVSKSDIKVTQLAGETWNKVTKISGVSEFTVETPSTVATVRGTEFSINDEEVDVMEGEVDYGPKDKPHIKVRAGNRAIMQIMAEEGISPEKLARLQQFPGKYEKVLKKVRAREIRKHKGILKMAANKGMTEEKIHQQLNEIDEGRQDEDKAYQEVPSIMKPKARRTYLLTKEIKKAKAHMRQ